MKGVLASYRWRRRLAWLTVTAAVAAGAVAVALEWPNTAPKEQPVSNIPLHLDYRPPKSVRLKLHDKALALAVASRFIYTAIARKDIDHSWNLVAPELRAGLTRKQWDTGNMPFPPYPVRDARWKVDYSDVKGVGFQIALFPSKGSHQAAQVFLIGLHAVRSGKQRTFLVDNWQAAPTRGLQAGGPVGNGSGSVIEQVTPRLSPVLGKSRESPAWLLLPVGLLSLIVLIPLGVGSVNWYRGHRARAKLGL